jgi:AcrR family transcriptional regulator
VPRAALRPDDIAAFRRRAADAAMQLFAEQGYEGVTMRALAAELGCSPMTPYRYFQGKAELYALVRTEAFRRFADRQEKAASGGGSVIDRLLRLKKSYIRFAVDQPDAYRIMFELRQPTARRHGELGAQSKRAFSYLHAAVAEAVAAGHFSGDPLTIAHILWANTHGLVSLHLAGKLGMGRSLDDLAAVALELPIAAAASRRNA